MREIAIVDSMRTVHGGHVKNIWLTLTAFILCLSCTSKLALAEPDLAVPAVQPQYSLAAAYTLPHESFMHEVQLAADGLMLARSHEIMVKGSKEDVLQLHRALNGELISTIRFPDDNFRIATSSGTTNPAFAASGKLMAVGTGSGNVTVYNTSTGKLAHTLRVAEYQKIKTVALSRDGKLAAAICDSRVVSVWDIASKKKLWQTEVRPASMILPDDPVVAESVAFSPDGTMLALAKGSRYRGDIELRSASTGKIRRTWQAHKSRISYVVFSPDGKKLGSVGYDNVFGIWKPTDGTLLYELKGHRGVMIGLALAFSPDNKNVVTGGGTFDHNIILWSSETGELQQTLTDHEDALFSFAFTGDGTLISTDIAGKVKVWRSGPVREPSLEGKAP